MIEGQIAIVRRIMRLPRISQKERLCLSELLKMLYAFRKELLLPDQGQTIPLSEFIRINTTPDVTD